MKEIKSFINDLKIKLTTSAFFKKIKICNNEFKEKTQRTPIKQTFLKLRPRPQLPVVHPSADTPPILQAYIVLLSTKSFSPVEEDKTTTIPVSKSDIISISSKKSNHISNFLYRIVSYLSNSINSSSTSSYCGSL